MTDLLNTFNAITGLDWTQEQLKLAGEKTWYVQRMLTMRYGNTGEADRTFPARLMQPKASGAVTACRLWACRGPWTTSTPTGGSMTRAGRCPKRRNGPYNLPIIRLAGVSVRVAVLVGAGSVAPPPLRYLSGGRILRCWRSRCQI